MAEPFFGILSNIESAEHRWICQMFTRAMETLKGVTLHTVLIHLKSWSSFYIRYEFVNKISEKGFNRSTSLLVGDFPLSQRESTSVLR